MSNQGIGADDNLVLILNAIHWRGPSRRLAVTFDEYHQGYGREPGIWSLIGTPARLGLAQLAMAFVLLVFAAGRRLGRPIPLREGFRQRNEYLTSMSSLLRRGRALGLVKSELRRRFMEDAAHALGLPPRADAESVIAEAERRHHPSAGELRRLMVDSWSDAGDTDESALLALAWRWHAMRKELTKTR